MNKRFIFRKEKWGYLAQDLFNDRVWALSRDMYNRILRHDTSCPMFMDNPYRYDKVFSLGDGLVPSDLSAPISISWSITSRCNCRCVYCCTDSINSVVTTPEADLHRIDNILHVFRQWGILRVIIGGGEPLLREDIFDVLDLFRGRGLKPVIATNGTLLNDRSLYKISETCINLQISLDTLKPQLYKELRGSDNLESVCAGIKAAAASGILVRIVTVVTKKNIGDLMEIADFLGRLGIRQWFIFELLPSGRGASVYDDFHIRDNDFIRRIKAYAEQKYPSLSVWYWGNRKHDYVSVYVLPDGTLNLVDYKTDCHRVYTGMDFHYSDAEHFWNSLTEESRINMLNNFISPNRV